MSEPIKDLETAVRELGALPVPVGVKPLAAEGQARTMLDRARDALNARMTKDDLRLVLENVVTYAAALESRVAELEADREANDREYETATARIAELEAGPALPWAHAMSDADLAGFLDHLVSAALDRWRTDSDGKAYPDRGTLAAIERACAAWRTPGQGYRSDDDAPDFYEPGHTYSAANGTDWKFRVDTVTTHPENGERTALGWRHFGGEWEPYAYHEDDWDVHQHVGHVDITGGAS